MSSKWPQRPLSDCATWYSGGTPSKSNPGYWDGDIPWISAKSLTDFFVSTSVDKVTKHGAANGTRLVPKDSILFVVRGMSLKTEFRMGITTRPVTFNQDLKALVAADDLSPFFLAYSIKAQAPKILSFVGEAGHGTGVLPTDRIQGLSIPIPPLPEQRAIAHILGTLDDKIELNRRMNETLEAMARALFHDWFVAFGPTRAKMVGKERYLPKHLWELFPDALDDAGIPAGWQSTAVSDLIEFNPTERLSKNTVAPYLDMASLPTQGSWPATPVPRAYGSGMRFRNGDALMARITPCLENGKTSFIQCLEDDQVGWGSTEYIVMRSKDPVPPEFSYLLARDKDFRQHAIRSMTGTSGRQRAQADSVASYTIACPSEPPLWASLGKMIKPMFAGIKVRSGESETLSALRDTLLPKLIAGELRISNIDKILDRIQ